MKNLSTGSEASATGESLNSGGPAVHPAARHRPKSALVVRVPSFAAGEDSRPQRGDTRSVTREKVGER